METTNGEKTRKIFCGEEKGIVDSLSKEIGRGDYSRVVAYIGRSSLASIWDHKVLTVGFNCYRVYYQTLVTESLKNSASVSEILLII